MEKFNKLLSTGPKILNIGLQSFYESCETQGIPVVHIRWEPPAQGNPKLLSLLDELL